MIEALRPLIGDQDAEMFGLGEGTQGIDQFVRDSVYALVLLQACVSVVPVVRTRENPRRTSAEGSQGSMTDVSRSGQGVFQKP